MQVLSKILGTSVCLALLVGASAALALDAAGEGRRVYLRVNCYGCHGGRVGGGMGPNFRGERPDAGDIREVIRQGDEGGMPAYPTLTDTDINNLSAYFKTLRTPAEPTFTHWWETVPTQ
jgi:mono/diheme cytochrome c family protein